MYALHFLLPFVVAGVVLVHIAYLHVMGSGSASAVPGTTMDGEAFTMYYGKDAVYSVLMQSIGGVQCSYLQRYTSHHT